MAAVLVAALCVALIAAAMWWQKNRVETGESLGIGVSAAVPA